MLEEIRLAQIATYPVAGIPLSDLKRVNFFFGTNGSGKTTISRVIADPSATAHGACSVAWQGNRPLETLVYNTSFVENNFNAQLPGIFTLGEVEKDQLDAVEAARLKAEEFGRDIVNLEATLGGTGRGKIGEGEVLRQTFEEACWELKTAHDAQFQGASTGARGSRARFCDRVLDEHAGNVADLHTIDDLQKRAQTVFADGATTRPALPVPDGDSLSVLATSPILAKKVVGKSDIDIGGMIRKLGNSDWVREGMQYATAPGEPCPFCQKPLDHDLLAHLNEFFDDAYAADLKAIANLEQQYHLQSEALLRVIDGILAAPGAYLDEQVFRVAAERLRSLLTLNLAHIERKKKEPSTPVALEDIAQATADCSPSAPMAQIQG